MGKLIINQSDIDYGNKRSMRSCPAYLAYRRENPNVSFMAGSNGIYFTDGTGIRYSPALRKMVYDYDYNHIEFVPGEYDIEDTPVSSRIVMEERIK